MEEKNSIRISVGIPAYNEGKNISNLLEALLSQKLYAVHISEIMVIASGCTDDTVRQVEAIQKKHAVISLVIQERRSGKSSAVNIFLSKAKESICVIESADTIPAATAVEELCAPFSNAETGMAGAHPVPTNKADNFIGFCVRDMWEMHHQVALKNPKCGEMIAFRNVFGKIPAHSAVDEASIEAEIKQHNLKIIYVPKAVVYNKGPETAGEFIAQRRRINAGHIWLKKQHGYKISTGSHSSVIKIALKQFRLKSVKKTWLLGMIALEVWSRILAYGDYYLNKKNYAVWDRIAGTKNPDVN